MPSEENKSKEQKAAESEVESFRKDFGPFVVAAETVRHIGTLVSWLGMLMSFLQVLFCLRVIAFPLMLSGHLHFKTRT